jgi:uracil phosphoribosyltransferase
VETLESLKLNQTDLPAAEIKHLYGSKVHILASPTLLTLLAQLCEKATVQPLVSDLVTKLYHQLLNRVIDNEFPLDEAEVSTRMSDYHKVEGVYRGPVLSSKTKAVSVNLARAGTLPSHVCYMALNYLLPPENVRQDHISIARTTDENEIVQGSQISGHKIGGDIEDSIVLIPDPMGATGGTLVRTLELYKSLGKSSKQKKPKFIALHCIVTPEYLKKVKEECPELVIYAIRLDRGLSPKGILETVPGTHWDQEKGLNDKQYIVPGGGGFGEVLNNAYV